MKRGEIWWANLRPPRGSEPGFRRPVVIVSEDRFNASTIQTVIVVSLTTNLRLAPMPGNVSVPARGTGLPTASVANVTQVSAIDRRDLESRIGQLSTGVMDGIDKGLRLVLAL